MEKLYQHKAWMQEGMYVVGSIPKSLGEGVFVEVYSVQYHLAWQYWDEHVEKRINIYQWRMGSLVPVGRKMRRNGITFYVPIPPTRATA